MSDDLRCDEFMQTILCQYRRVRSSVIHKSVKLIILVLAIVVSRL